jgi:hypothetical protein
MEDWKIRIVALWLIAELVAIAGNLLELYEPDVIEGLIAGEMAGMKMTPELMVVNAILFLIAPLMAFLSLFCNIRYSLRQTIKEPARRGKSKGLIYPS